MVKIYNRIGTKLLIPPSYDDRSGVKYYLYRMKKLGELQKQIARCLGYKIYLEWEDNERSKLEVNCIRYSMFNRMLSGKKYTYRKNSDSIMEVELNPPGDIEDKFIEIYQNIYAEDVFICSTDSETDDIIIARTDLGNNEYRLTEIVFHEGMAKIRQGVISNRGGCIFAQPKNNVPMDDILDTISDVSRELRDILDKYNIY